MNASITFSYTTQSRVRVFVHEERPGRCEFLRQLNPIRFTDLLNDSSKVGIFSPQTFPEGQIVYYFITKADLRHTFLHTFEIYRRIWAVLWMVDGSIQGFEENIEKKSQYVKRKYSEALIVRFFILNASNPSFTFSPEVTILPADAVSEEDVWRPILYRLTLDLLEAFSAQEMQLKTWIESPYESIQAKDRSDGLRTEVLETNSYEQVLELDMNMVERKKIQLKGRKTKIMADLYLLSGHVLDALKRSVFLSIFPRGREETDGRKKENFDLNHRGNPSSRFFPMKSRAFYRKARSSLFHERLGVINEPKSSFLKDP
ncbi:hypothetical protein PCK1_000722 [Pneumocystis canis]|nr:hypothetical protein PCK1_000722 [Pneumocystis canis]